MIKFCLILIFLDTSEINIVLTCGNCLRIFELDQIRHRFPKYCPNIAKILSKFYSNIIQILSRYVPNNVQMLSKNYPKQCLNSVQNDVQIFPKYCPSIALILSKYYPNIIEI